MASVEYGIGFFPACVSGGGGGVHGFTHAEGGIDPVSLSQSQIANLVSDLAGKVATTTQVIAGSGLTGGGALSSNVTLAVDVISAAQHGNQTDGSIHAVASGTTNGFMSSSDYTKLFSVASGATNTPLGSANPSNVGTTAPGTSGSASHEDHVHAHGNQSGGSLHSVATTTVDGFFASSDKVRLDGMATGATNTPLGTASPENVGTTSAGSSTYASKQDHVHAHGNQAGGSLHSDASTSVAGFLSASDKTRLDGMATGATNTPLSSSNPSDVGTTSPGSGTSASKYDHVHAHGNQAGGSLHSDATTSVAGFISASDKTRLDGMATGATNTPLSSSTPSDVGTASPGSGTSASKYDHVHAHGNQGGGSLHSVATTGTAGFMSATDKGKVDTCISTEETSDYMLFPAYLPAAQSTRLCTSFYYGARYIVTKKVSFTKIYARLTASIILSEVRISIYQKSDGCSGVSSLVATGYYTCAAGGAQQVTITASGTLVPGVCYVLFGQNNLINSTMRVFGNAALDLGNQNIPAGKIPFTFTTAILSIGSPPSTFDPVNDTTATTTDVAAVIRLGN